MSTWLSPPWRSSASLVRTSAIIQSCSWAPVVQTLVPFTIQPSSAGVARVTTDARSLPESGSLIPMQNESSPRQIAGRKRSFCSRVPTLASSGPLWRSATQWWPTGAPQRRSSSATTKRSTAARSPPPYSRGNDMPTHPRAASAWENAGSFRPAMPSPGSNDPRGSVVARNSRTSVCSARSTSLSSVNSNCNRSLPLAPERQAIARRARADSRAGCGVGPRARSRRRRRGSRWGGRCPRGAASRSRGARARCR